MVFEKHGRYLRTPRPNNENHPPIKRKHSDSEESTESLSEDVSTRWDQLLEQNVQQRQVAMETHVHYLDFLGQVRDLFTAHSNMLVRLTSLEENVDRKSEEVVELERKLEKARKLIDIEKRQANNAKKERDSLRNQVVQVKDLLNVGSSHIPDDVKSKLSFLYSPTDHDQEKNFNVINSTGSILSDLSYSKSEDDLDENKVWKKHRPSAEGVADAPPSKKRRSSGVRTGEVRGNLEGRHGRRSGIPALSTIKVGIEEIAKGVVDSPDFGHKDSARQFHDRPHQFQNKTIVMPENCNVCSKRIRFGRNALKCKTCKTLCHPECKDLAPLPCTPQQQTPKHNSGLLSDYTPNINPMIPPLIIHCVREIESRGLNEVGVYRVSGAERDVRTLKEKLLKGRGAPTLTTIDIHAVCGVLKDFLRGLQEPLVPRSMWNKFVNAVESSEELKEAVEDLPQPNRDTMAYLVVHLQKIAANTNTKMPIDNLAKIFGITIIGCSSKDVAADVFAKEVVPVTRVMEELLKIDRDYWETFLDPEHGHVDQMRMQPTASTDSLLRSVSTREYFTPKRMSTQPKFFPSLIMS